MDGKITVSRFDARLMMEQNNNQFYNYYYYYSKFEKQWELWSRMVYITNSILLTHLEILRKLPRNKQKNMKKKKKVYNKFIFIVIWFLKNSFLFK